MLFSVIIPTYNRKERVVRAVSSVLTQSLHTDWEIVVCDDGSTDGTYEALTKMAEADSRLRVLRNEKNSGQHTARNNAICASTGKWIVFLDSDDWFSPERLAALKARIESDVRKYDFIYCNAATLHNGKWGKLFTEASYPTGSLPGWYAVGPKYAPYVTSTVAIRKKVFADVGLFRQDMKVLEDTELYARIFKAGYLVSYQYETLVYRESHSGQITRNHLTCFKESMMAYKSGGAPALLYAAQWLRLARQTSVWIAKSSVKRLLRIK